MKMLNELFASLFHETLRKVHPAFLLQQLGRSIAHSKYQLYTFSVLLNWCTTISKHLQLKRFVVRKKRVLYNSISDACRLNFKFCSILRIHLEPAVSSSHATTIDLFGCVFRVVLSDFNEHKAEKKISTANEASRTFG